MWAQPGAGYDDSSEDLQVSVGGWGPRGPSRPRSGLGSALPSSMFDLGRKTGYWGTQMLAVKWRAMAAFQGTGKVKALYLQHRAPTDKLY